MAGYTCNTCGVVFDTAAGQRDHMKSDWHRYNLKRRVADLPSITEATFDEKVSNANAEKEELDKSKKTKVKQLTKKEMRRLEKEKLLAKKQELLELAKQSMLKNMQEEAAKDEMKDTPEEEQPQETPEEKTSEENVLEENIPEENKPEEGLSPEELAEKLMAEKLQNRVEIDKTECLFTGKKLKTFEENLDQMFKNHGFYIPEQKYLIDKEGLFQYFSEKIGLGNMCLVCSYQGRSLEAVRAHMLAKKHCRIPYESEAEKLEISEFYDFSSTYEELDKAANEDESQWEDIEEEADAASGKVDGSQDDNEEEEEEEELPEYALYNDGVELHLPTGVKVGHRTLQRYYRQNLKPERELSEGQGTIIAADTRHFATIYDRQQQQLQKKVWQTELKDKKRDDKRAAKFVNNQPHYRDQLLQ